MKYRVTQYDLWLLRYRDLYCRAEYDFGGVIRSVV
jgi:hypothetical protein